MSKFVNVNIILLLAVLLFFVHTEISAKNKNPKTLKPVNYEKEWKAVDSLINIGLTKSAIEVVNRIYAKAKEDNLTVQLVKSVLYKLRLESDFEEDYRAKAIEELQFELKTAVFPLKNIFHSVIAELYWNYYLQNRYKILKRSETVNFIQSDIRTWGLMKIVGETIKNYNLSLTNADELKKTELKVFDDILIKEPSGRKFRPTLYDFLAQRAVDFYMKEEPSITRPLSKFELNSADYFKPIEEFVKINISSQINTNPTSNIQHSKLIIDSLSLKFNAIKTIQELLAFHLNDQSPQSLIDVNLKRLQLLKESSVVEFKDSLYLKAMIDFEKQYLKSAYSTDISYQIALEYHNKAALYKPLVSDKYKWFNKNAYNYCTEAIKRFPESDGARNCMLLQSTIIEKSVSITLENANIPNLPFKALLQYRNAPEIFFRIIKTDMDESNNFVEKLYGKELVDKYLSLAVVTEWSVKLPDDGDYQEHNVEFKVPELDFGCYTLLASTDKSFSYKKQQLVFSNFWTTNISCIRKRNDDKNLELLILNRVTGVPIKNVDVQTYYREYDYNARTYRSIKWKAFTSDENGQVVISTANERQRLDQIYEVFTLKNDKFISNDYIYNVSNQEPRKQTKTFFFTDRAIYRPGQTVFFKGIVIETEGDVSAIRTKFQNSVILYDANYKQISKLDLISNDFGSITGSFTIPQGVLTGSFHISNSSGDAFFAVEEYKRPKFEVMFEPIKGAYKIGEEIKLVAKAFSYAGVPLDKAEVKYRVVRHISYPYRDECSYYYMPPTSSPEVEITNNTAVTNEKGEVTVTFKATADLSATRKQNPVFDFTVTVDITDINGESHTAVKSVSVAYNALLVSTDIADIVNKDDFRKFKLNITNLNGEKEVVKGNILIHQLVQPVQTYRKRQWSLPDKFLLTSDEHSKLFPLDEFNDENNLSKWAYKSKVFEFNFDTKKDTVINLKSVDFNQGTYILIINTTDAFGEKLEKKTYFTVNSHKDKSNPNNSVVWFTKDKDSAEPGDKISLTIGSKEKNMKLIYEIYCKDKVISRQWITLNDSKQILEIPVKEEFRGNFTIMFTAVKNNRIYKLNEMITVPYTNKQLDLSIETFRDRLAPGQKEQWKLTIKDKKGEKAIAEMVASLYDASLDVFKPSNWYFDIYKAFSSIVPWYDENSFSINASQDYSEKPSSPFSPIYRKYERLNWFGYFVAGNYGFMETSYAQGKYKMFNAPMMAKTGISSDAQMGGAAKNSEESVALTNDMSNMKERREKSKPEPVKPIDYGDNKLRSNFNETAFFYPELLTNENGETVIKFTLPESLTRWKLLSLAHTKDLKYGFLFKELITKKDLMVTPNNPRFFREGDKVFLSAKISNQFDKNLKGQAELKLIDASTLKSLDKIAENNNQYQNFEVKQGQSIPLFWEITVPEGISGIIYRITIKAASFVDGEEMIIPVLPNRMLVTESFPLQIKGKQSKNFVFKRLLDSEESKTLRNHKLTLEFTSNPSWYAVQALPYLIETPFESADAIFSRYYANSIASYIINFNPKIKQVFDNWKHLTPDAFLSNLEKNQELKSVILEETPWVLQAKDESERKQRISLLFDLNRLTDDLNRALDKLIKLQTPNGGWAWFDGMPENRYITQYILTGLGHLKNLGIKNISPINQALWKSVNLAVRYMDNMIKEDYNNIVRMYPKELDKNHLDSYQIQYLYARSFFLQDIEMNDDVKDSYNYFIKQSKKYWLSKNFYMQSMIALSLNRIQDEKTAKGIIKSLKEKSLKSDEMGMYWRNDEEYYTWQQALIETQALMIEAFDEITQDASAVENMKIWLLKQKQTQDWKTTKATAEACYALLLRGADILASDKIPLINLDGKNVSPEKADAGTGYFKTSWSENDVKPEMAKVSITKEDEGIAWGALYWQYFEQLDKITKNKSPLNIEKKLFIKRNTPSGPVLDPIQDNQIIKLGDKVIVRIELRSDRDMEFIHLKDMRACCFEPVNVISTYKYQENLGYYEATADASTNFFFSFIPKGTFVFEYPLNTTIKGNFSNGISTVQCLYAPEFSSHSEGIRIIVN